MNITKQKTLRVKEALKNPIELVFMNRKGGYDTIQLTKFKLSTLDINSATYNVASTTRTYKVDASTKQTYYSPYLSISDFEWLKDLATSIYVYIDGEYVRVLSIKGFELDNYVDIWNFEITVASEYDENKITS